MAKRRKKIDNANKLPRSPDFKAAQQSLMQSNVLNLMGGQQRLQEVLQGLFSSPRLRSGGTSVYGYSVRRPRGDPGWKRYYR